MPLYGNTWIDENPHPTPWPCMEWINPTTGERRFRNVANTAYIDHGNVNEAMAGAVDSSGDTMTGPLLGAHGLPPLENPDFQEGAFVEGQRVATSNQMAEMQRFLLSRMSVEIKQMFLSLKKLEAGASNPTVVKECAFWMVASVPFSSSAAMVIRDPVQVGDFFDIETTAIEVLQTGYYEIEQLPLAVRYQAWGLNSNGGRAKVTYVKSASCDVYKNDAPIPADDPFSGAKARLGEYSSNSNSCNHDKGMPFAHYVSAPAQDYLTRRLKFTAGDRLTFKDSSYIVPAYGQLFDGDGNRVADSGPYWIFPPLGFRIRFVTFI